MARFDTVRREIVAPRTLAVKLLATAVAILLPAILRWTVDRGIGGTPYVTFWPAVLLATVFLGWRYGTLTAVGSIAVVRLVFLPNAAGAGNPIDVLPILPFFLAGVAIMIVVGHFLRSVVLELNERVRQSDAFNEELQHRAKNALQMIRALASRAAQATDPVEFYQTLARRLDALSEANELLRFGVLDSCELEDLVKIALRPFPGAQITCSGPGCRVVKEAVTPLTMVIHELGTNASKYGALSCPTGAVALSWRPNEDRVIAVEWVESGGPPVAPPRRFGIGARLLKPHGPIRAVDLDYAPGGLRCAMQIEGGFGQPAAARNRATASSLPISGSSAAMSGP